MDELTNKHDCKRCGKVNPGVHTCSPMDHKSSCCGMRTYVTNGREINPPPDYIRKGSTYYNVCVKCENPCDVVEVK